MENNEAKQKAKELIEWFCKTISNDKNAPTKLLIKIAKQCAIKVCEEVLSMDKNKASRGLFIPYTINDKLFYKQVKKEIENYEQ